MELLCHGTTIIGNKKLLFLGSYIKKIITISLIVEIFYTT